ncbi:unnamed protein product [Zymoseptoria tritici ST99CH_3D7]|uniref:Uncharacterized protein n=1 Tax=Zymoseptoria tritici (strain ST99CH_3D7) TaxID=1276538 RepID=A0A1X7RHY9_ZYMT9|nr:unnamed protein product [Zymoseptoria tritici ST99CH_3D7]
MTEDFGTETAISFCDGQSPALLPLRDIHDEVIAAADIVPVAEYIALDCELSGTALLVRHDARTTDGYSSRTDTNAEAEMSSTNIDWDALQDRSVIITGGASGLGEATATKFIQHGAYVTIADMDDALGERLVANLGDRATYVHCDTTDWTSSAAAFKHAARHAPSKTLDIAVLFAGVGGESKGLIDLALEQPLPSLSADDDPAQPAHKAIDVNLIGVYISTYLSLHYFRLPAAQPQTFTKSLVLISSMMGYIDGPYNTGYSASKFGVRGLFCSVRGQAHKVNARINNIAPGYILTPLTQRVHQIERPDQPSKATGLVLPWASIDHVVDGVGRCAVDEKTAGKTLAIVPSGVVDMEEDIPTGYGGAKWAQVLEEEGFTKLTTLFPTKA